MRYGIKVNPPETLAVEWRAIYGEPAEFFVKARRLGADFVEFVFEEGSVTADVLALGRLAAQAGLFSAAHPYLFGPMAAEAFSPVGAGKLFEPLLDLGQRLSDLTGRPLDMVFHGGHANVKPHNRGLAQATSAARQFFRWAAQQTAARFPGVRILCETQMPHERGNDGLVRVGDTYETAMALVEGSDVRLCWDFGHTFSAVLLGKHAELPGQTFVRRVGHVHAHDTAKTPAGAIDHRPLGENLCPWRQYMRMLKDVGFDGNMLFEVGLLPLGGYGGLSRMLEYSIREVEAVGAKKA